MQVDGLSLTPSAVLDELYESPPPCCSHCLPSLLPPFTTPSNVCIPSTTSSHSSAWSYEPCGTRAAFLGGDVKQKCIKFPIWNPSLGVCVCVHVWVCMIRLENRDEAELRGLTNPQVPEHLNLQSFWQQLRNSKYMGFKSLRIPGIYSKCTSQKPRRPVQYRAGGFHLGLWSKMPVKRLTSLSILHMTIHRPLGCVTAVLREKSIW